VRRKLSPAEASIIFVPTPNLRSPSPFATAQRISSPCPSLANDSGFAKAQMSNPLARGDGLLSNFHFLVLVSRWMFCNPVSQ
jgi:hypothetical protein